MLRFGKYLFILTLMMFCSALPMHATHIMGGEMYYKRLASDSFQITMYFYVDCVNGNSGAIELDREAIFGFFNASTKELLSTISVVRSAPILVSEVNYECITNKPNACVHKYEYATIVKINPGEDGLIVAFQRCCRNKTIDNIFDPEATGMTLFVNIPPVSIQNDNPVFKKLPPNFLCNDAPLVFDHSAVDADGDSLVYELYTPYFGASDASPRPTKPSTPPYQNILFISPYYAGDMMGGSDKLKIDSKTGKLTVKPMQTGQFVVGIKVSEFRKGVKIGETLRDYQFNVLQCQLTVKADFMLPPVTCDTRLIQLINKSESAQNFHWDFGDKQKTNDTSNASSPSFLYQKPGTYLIRLKVSNKNCVDSISRSITILEYDSIQADFDVSKDTVCIGQPVYIINNSTQTPYWWWNLGDNSADKYKERIESYIYQLPGVYKIRLRIKSNGECENIDSSFKVITVVDLNLANSNFSFEVDKSCDPTNYQFVKQTDHVANWKWVIDSDTFDQTDVLKHSFISAGKHRVQLLPKPNLAFCESYENIDSVILVGDEIPELENLLIPNIFTPNDDQFNECYQLDGDYIECVEVKILIYNRWGELLYNSEVDGNCWSGENLKTGVKHPPGTYFTLISVFDKFGEEIYKRTNTVTLIR